MIAADALFHDPLYVVVAVIACALGAAAALRDVRTLRGAQPGDGVRRLRVRAAVVGGLSVWCTHFIAMAGYRPDLALSVTAGSMLLSAVVAVVVIGGALAASSRARSGGALAGCALLASGGVALMHYLGVSGLTGCVIETDPRLLAVVVFAASVPALAAFALNAGGRGALATAALAGSVAIHHFGAIAVMRLTPVSAAEDGFGLQPSAAALIVVLAAAFLLEGRSALGEFYRALEAQRTGMASLESGEGVAEVDAEGAVAWSNEALRRRLVATAADLRRGGLVVAVERFAGQAAAASLRSALSETRPSSCVVATGDGRFVEFALRPRATPGPGAARIVAACRDVTDRVEAERANARLAMVASHAQDAILIADAAGRVTWVNAAFERLTGFTLADAEGRTPGEILQCEETCPEARARIRAALAARAAVREQLVNVSRDGRRYWIDLEISPVFGQSGDELQFIGISRCIDEQKAREAALEEARRQAEAADKAKGEFLATMSHEIRTPLNGVIGMSELMKRTDLDERQRTYLRHVRQSADNLLAIVTDILDFTRLHAGQLDFDDAPYVLADVVTGPARRAAAAAEAKGVRVVARVAPALPATVLGDEARVAQIVGNLAGNAVKFTERGLIRIDADRATGSDGADRLRIEVRDTGIGIPADKLEAIFGRFSQVDASATRRHEGTGLGLAICKGLAEAMGGAVTVRSTPGVGSVFRVELPLRPVEEGDAEPDVAGVRALVVDGAPERRELLLELAEAWGVHAVAAQDGAEALRETDAALAEGRPFDVAIVDLAAPRVGDREVDEALRSRIDGLGVVLTSDAGRGLAERTQDHRRRERRVAAPFAPHELREALHDLLTPALLAEAHARAPHAGAKAPVRRAHSP